MATGGDEGDDPTQPIRKTPIADPTSTVPLGDPLAAPWRPGWTARPRSARWWTMLLRGIAAIVLGVVSLFVPGVTFLGLVFAFGVYALVDGVLSFLIGRRSVIDPLWSSGFFHGIAGVVAGFLALLWPGITAVVLLLVIGSWALATGLLESYAAIKERTMLRHEWLLAVQGIVSVAFGIVLVIAPATAAIAIGLWIGTFALVLGGVLVASALQLRRAHHHQFTMTT
jgi:uncharacterized membrane protein HdeD (DUF308 family)